MDFFYPKRADVKLKDMLNLEWIETNGLGTYASSTVANCHTRKYHGLLVSKLANLADKYVLLSKVEDLVIQNGTTSYLTSHMYPNFCQDGGFTNLERFQYTTHPIWHYKLPSGLLVKELMLMWQENSVLFKYTIDGKNTGKISFRPLLAFRNYHQLQHENSALLQQIVSLDDGFSYAPYTIFPRIFFQVSVPHEIIPDPTWYRNFIYTKEQERGYDYFEDLFSPGVLLFDFKEARDVIIICSLHSTHKCNSVIMRSGLS